MMSFMMFFAKQILQILRLGALVELLHYFFTPEKCRKVKTNVHKITRILGIFSNDLITMFAPPPPTPPCCHTPRCCNRRSHPGPSSTCTAWFGSTCPRNWKSGIVKSRSLYIQIFKFPQGFFNKLLLYKTKIRKQHLFASASTVRRSKNIASATFTFFGILGIFNPVGFSK